MNLYGFRYEFSVALISAWALLKYTSLRQPCWSENRLVIFQRVAAIYGMCINTITLLHLKNKIIIRVFIDSLQTIDSSQARNLLRPNNLSGDLTDGCVNNFTNHARRWTEVQGVR